MCECPGCYKGVGCVECGLCRREKDDGVIPIAKKRQVTRERKPPKKCKKCDGWMDAAATECPWCDTPM